MTYNEKLIKKNNRRRRANIIKTITKKIFNFSVIVIIIILFNYLFIKTLNSELKRLNNIDNGHREEALIKKGCYSLSQTEAQENSFCAEWLTIEELAQLKK